MLGIASRFSVLKIEGEDNPRNPNKKKAEKVDLKKQPNQNGKATSSKKKSGPSPQNGQQTAGGSSKSKSKPPKAKVVTDAQWEEWKKKDAQYVDENYAGELQEAILQSKLEYEQNKDFYDRVRKESEADKKLAAGGKKKKKAMTLEEFKNFQENTGNDIEEKDSHVENGATAVEDPEFFSRIKLEAKEVIQKEETKKKIKEREPLLDEAISIAQYQVKLEEKDAEIASLSEELAQVKANLTKVKSRNKQLCSIIGQSEVRDKAEILVELHKLQSVKDELTEEVANLHVQLEQERSKANSHTSTDGKGKGGKKRTASETHN
ncbi:hypothetical protein FOCC_FOCC011728 [Frankliniella occidentalis]|uniref:G kinase-anchoring protein 1 n=1 Tax=Frankliniella occidentalis TaxID=133901 RepID=A0A6J1S5B1_FRAOC|nr:G kinase-anchoring protein 1 [Frankliniella occidentalis]KAE8742697.1 hypothetical protein FOCC_FOCC011728 [Frankliniella occidentalis]